MTRELTIGFSVFGQPKMLEFWFECFMKQPIEWRDRVEVIVVDDHGTPKAAVPKVAGVSLYRVRDDIDWNQGGARNLVAQEASTDRLMLIDPDMTLHDGMLQKLIEESRHLTTGLMFRPCLRHIATEAFDHTSPNVHLILKKDFAKMGGYSSEYSGHKGYGDVELLRVMQKFMVTRTREDLWFWFHHGNKKIPDAQVVTLDRSTKHNKALHIKRMAQLARHGVHKFIETRKPMVWFKWDKIQ